MKTTALALGLALPALLATAPALAAKEVHQTVPLDADGTLTIKTYKGSITIETGAAAEARIDARVEPDGDDRDQARKVEETKVEIRGSGRSVAVRSDYDDVKSRHHFFSWNDDGTLPFVHYRITMPKTARLVIDDYKSEIEVAPLSSDLTLETYKGRARIRGLEGNGRLTTYKGDVRVDVPRLAGDLRCETYKGTFDVTLPKDARFSLDAESGRRGTFETDFPAAVASARRGRHDEDRVRGDVNGGGPRVEMETYKGTLRLRAK